MQRALSETWGAILVSFLPDLHWALPNHQLPSVISDLLKDQKLLTASFTPFFTPPTTHDPGLPLALLFPSAGANQHLDPHLHMTEIGSRPGPQYV